MTDLNVFGQMCNEKNFSRDAKVIAWADPEVEAWSLNPPEKSQKYRFLNNIGPDP